jgi:hypothetical protein
MSAETDSDCGSSSDSESADPTDSDDSSNHRGVDKERNDHLMDRSENGPPDGGEYQDDFMADIDRVIRRAKEAEKQ